MRVAVALLLAAGALAAAGCSDDDAQGGSTTVGTGTPTTTETTAVVTTAAPATTSTPTTSDPPPTSTPATTTSAPPTTTTPPVDEEALKAEIAEDYEQAYYRGYRMLEQPRLRNLEARAAEVLASGSPAFDVFVARVRELVALGDAVVPNDPDLLSASVENVELVGQGPFRRATVTVCEVTNRKQVTLPENSPSGEQIEVAGSGELLVTRFEEPVRLTRNGWLRFRTPREGTGFPGETTCPPA